MGDAKLYDQQSPWALDGAAVATPAPIVKPPSGITADLRRRMAKAIVDFEARRANGKLSVYHPPANDGGGAYEVAGINVKYHPERAKRLRSLIEAGKADQAEAEAIDYILDYTKPAAGWTPHAGVEFYLRDCIFNRGPKGAARILQRALAVDDDGEIGPQSRAAMEKLKPDQIITKLRAGREDYERKVVGYRANFWRGLVNRWDKAAVKAREFQKEQGALPPVVRRTIETGIGGGIVGFALWDLIVAHPLIAALIVAGVIALCAYGWRRLKAWRDTPPVAPVAPVPAIIKDM
jgi:lysozyme family protein